MTDLLFDWLERLEQRQPKKINLGLERIARVIKQLNLAPQVPVITVAGTNGKGSCCAYLEAILDAAGYRTGCFYSPHLIDFNERIQVERRSVAAADIVAAFELIEQGDNRRAHGDLPLTYFEFAVAAALAIFRRAGCEVIILEVGLGGRLDAVNAVDADVAVITSVSIDHVEQLGADRESIGLEKAGIMRPSSPVICGDRDPPASVLARAEQIGAPSLVRGRDFFVDIVPGAGTWCYRGKQIRDALPRPAMHGAHQYANASCALAALEELADRLPVNQAQVRGGLLGARLTGRFDVVLGDVPAMLDMGYFAYTEAVFAVRTRKDIAGIIAQMASRVDSWRIAPCADDTGSVDTIEKILAKTGSKFVSYPSVAAALSAATAATQGKRQARIVVFGSFATVEEYLQTDHQTRKEALSA